MPKKWMAVAALCAALGVGSWWGAHAVAAPTPSLPSECVCQDKGLELLGAMIFHCRCGNLDCAISFIKNSSSAIAISCK
jgi:hypothetical protein